MALPVGIHRRVKHAEYHLDPCLEPSLSRSIAETLLMQSPAHAFLQHPRLNEEWEVDLNVSRRTDIGSAAHMILCGLIHHCHIIYEKSYGSADARQMRDDAREKGLVPILIADFAKASKMARIAREFLMAMFGERDEEAEVTLVWQEGGAWCRARLDQVWNDYLFFLDYKTVTSSAAPADATNRFYSGNFHFQLAFYERGLNMLDPGNIGRRQCFCLFQEQEPPFACSLIAPDFAGMTIAQKMVNAAIEIWTQCVRDGVWPAYPPGPHYAVMPSWVERQWLEREMLDERLSGGRGPQGQPQPKKLFGPS